MRLRQYINELSFKTSAKIKVTKSSNDTFWTEFEIGDRTYEFRAHSYQIPFGEEDEKIKWEVSFLPKNWVKTDWEGIPVDHKDLSFAKNVFGAVAESLRMFVKAKNPFSFHFKPQTEKHRKLYERFAPMLAKAFPKYIYYRDYYKHTGRHMFELDPKYWKEKK